jgi:hypothetical protein
MQNHSIIRIRPLIHTITIMGFCALLETAMEPVESPADDCPANREELWEGHLVSDGKRGRQTLVEVRLHAVRFSSVGYGTELITR